MENFIYCTPTKLYFGKNMIENLPEIIAKYGKNVLLTYGSGSIKKIGLYQKVIDLLKDFNIYELSNIEPNPKYTSVLKGVEICKQNNIDVILSVGGGSVLDCSKAIAGCSLSDNDPWDVITSKVPTTKALPLVDILTLSATGSEFDSGAVISRSDTLDKLAYCNEHLFPVASILDPTYTFSVSLYQTAAGVSDAINHVIEQYFCSSSSILTDGLCEAVIKSLIENGRKVMNDPNNYNARSEIMACCSLACNGILSIGNSGSGWPCHSIEHALSGYYDITHGIGLAIITPRWMKYILNDQTVDRFVAFGTHIFNIDSTKDKYVIANETIEKLYEFFVELNIPMHLQEVGIDAKRIKEMSHHIAINEGLDRAYAKLNEEDIKKILIESL